MSEPSQNITKYLIIFCIGVFFIKILSGSTIFESKIHKGKGYLVHIPEGWEKVKKEKGTSYPKGVEVVKFVPKSIDSETQEPDLAISIYTKKLTTPIWIEDEFPDILKSISDEGYRILDTGEIKLDDVVSSWVVYHDKITPALNLEFYMVTDTSIFYKMQYTGPPEKFNLFRPLFEEFKNSFKFRFSLY